MMGYEDHNVICVGIIMSDVVLLYRIMVFVIKQYNDICVIDEFL